MCTPIIFLIGLYRVSRQEDVLQEMEGPLPILSQSLNENLMMSTDYRCVPGVLCIKVGT